MSNNKFKDSKNFIASVQYKQWADIVIVECPSEVLRANRQMKENYMEKKEKNQAFKCQPFIVWYFLSAGTGENQTSSVAFLLLFYNQFKTVLSWSLPETTICCFILEGIILKHKKAKSAINI